MRLLPTFFLLLTGTASAQELCYSEAEIQATTSVGSAVRRARSPDEIRRVIGEVLALADYRRSLGNPPEFARSRCVVAELMKRIGDLAARRYYESAIELAPENTEYRLLYGDYLRRFRGPLEPLFLDADRAYADAIESLPPAARECRPFLISCKIDRSVVALYEREGVRVSGRPGATSVFFSTQNSFSRSVIAPGEFDDIRALTSQAAFASSKERLNRPLSTDELRRMIPDALGVRTFNQLTVRNPSLPTFRFFFARDSLTEGQISNFFKPTELTDVEVSQFGLVVERPFILGSFDTLLRGEVRRGTRVGLVEFVPDGEEDFTAWIGRLVLSRFVGPNKLSVELNASYDAIDQSVEAPIDRNISIFAPALRYQWFGGASSEQQIVPRATEFFGGLSIRDEVFGSVTLREEDYFLAVSVKGMRGVVPGQNWEITIQPTVFKTGRSLSEVSNSVDTLENSQLRTHFSVLYRLRDKENERARDRLPTVALFNIVATGHLDFARAGANDFESVGVGAGAHIKLVVAGTSFLLSASYQVTDYRHLGVTRNQVQADLSMGF